MKISTRQRRSAVIRYSVLSVWLVIVIFPLFWIVATSFKPDTQWFQKISKHFICG